MKLNCWEFKKCGREPDGINVEKFGICPATTCDKLDGTHNGKNAGRACWVVTGTFAKKFKNCQECNFYNLIKNEEGFDFTLSCDLLNKLRA